MTMLDESKLLPGDVILYRPSGFFGRVIAIKTWHGVAHCEGYVGSGWSVASREGKGADIYRLRNDATVAHVLRPKVPCDVSSGIRWFTEHLQGEPYGWLDLLAFVGLGYDGPGVICSVALSMFYRRGCGLPLFANEPDAKIAPCTFLLSELLQDVTDQVWCEEK